jgi:hypothetical protein
MTDSASHKPYEWADKMFQGAPDVAPKYRDMLAMLASMLMGNEGATQHFYAKAVVDGASDEELQRVNDSVQMAVVNVGDIATNVQRAVEQMRDEQKPDEPGNTE